ncbi:5-(carboxyamino)imidazole ribonucleotide synthase [Aeromonas cavernicola]|uniref:N5-carboxyaminoimidazole ribonucleotide synthase n=1 Tax=Aeromonas cavernicola TaxID=1006623 RepID=A0A2H9U239_9GAMM|nr:5-(carboxyamino)imidazole ribonucleotide synthase [Aeromonas cavernicola]PJG58018.1 5-(carboxyamino)imidazole ribonucleotide synthase [Aeromonas cavernicola]
MIIPPATLGMLGGGQLGRYFVMAAHRLGYKVVVLDPDPASIAGAAADHHLVAPYDDPAALQELANRCAAISCEFENVPATTLALLAQHKPVRPAASAVGICQDRREEKALLASLGIPLAPHLALLPNEPIPAQASDLFPAILKTAREGYDGKGQWQIANWDELVTALATSNAPCVLEQKLALEGEFALTLARNPSGAVSALPLVQNWHSGGILDQTRSPANAPGLEREAKTIAERLIAALDYVGVLTVEFFLVAGQLLVNELAPRPHNSGHPSLDNADCCQFELQVRALCDLPLPAHIRVRPAMLINLLGDVWQAGTPNWPSLLALPGLHLHLYGKVDPRPNRKMGHVTITGADWQAVEETTHILRTQLGIAGHRSQ